MQTGSGRCIQIAAGWGDFMPASSLTRSLTDLDYKSMQEKLTSFISEYVGSAGAGGVVVGLSGGVDSSVVATLCVRALSSSRVMGIIMPTAFTPREDLADAEWLASWLSIRHRTVPIDPILEAYASQLGRSSQDSEARMAFANLRARIRMSILYFHANMLNYLVAGTGDRSEILIGYYTKYGDGGVDFLPVAGLYKTQLRHLAKSLGIPDRIALKPSSPQLYPGHRAVDELPADYDVLDPILYHLFDLGKSLDETAEFMGVSRELVRAVYERHLRTEHKRKMPASPPARI
ncbi:MAG: NAD+ synthase [Nitrososphaerota archaeon]